MCGRQGAARCLTFAFDAGGSHHFPETMLATFFAT